MAAPLLLAGVLLGAGASLVGAQADPALARAAALLQQGTDAFAAGLFNVAARDLDAFLALAPTATEAPRAHYLLGLSSYYRGAYTAALDQLGAHARRYPGSGHLRELGYWLGLTRLALGDHDGGLALLRSQRLQQPPSTYAAYAADAEARTLDEAGQVEAALAVYRTLIASFGLPSADRGPAAAAAQLAVAAVAEHPLLAVAPEWLQRAGILELGILQPERAATRFAAILEDFAQSPEAVGSLFLLGEASLQAGDPAGAERRYQRYVALFPDGEYRRAALFRLARLALDGGNVPLAVRRLADYETDAGAVGGPGSAGIRRGPAHFDLEILRGDVAIAADELKAAAAAYAAAAALPVGPAAVQRARFSAAATQAQVAAAVAVGSLAGAAERRRALAMYALVGEGPDRNLRAAALYNRVLLLVDADPQAAIDALQAFAAAHSGSPLRPQADALLLELLDPGDSQAALEVLERLAEARLLTPREQRVRGVALVDAGAEAAGLSQLSSLAVVEAASATAGLYQIGALYSRRGEYARAGTYFVQAAATQDDPSAATRELTARARLALATTYFNNGEYHRALASAEELLTPGAGGGQEWWTPEMRFLQGAASSRLADPRAAADAFAAAAETAVARSAQGSAHRAQLPLWREAATRHALSLFRAGLLPAAELAFAELAALDVDAATNLYRAGLAASRDHRPAIAVAYLTEARAQLSGRSAQLPELPSQASLYPTALYPALLYELATALLQGGDAAAASSTLDALEQADPNGVLTLIGGLRRAELLLQAGRAHAAEEAFLAVGARASPAHDELAEQAAYMAVIAAAARGAAAPLGNAWDFVAAYGGSVRVASVARILRAALAEADLAQLRRYYDLVTSPEATNVVPQVAGAVHFEFARAARSEDTAAAAEALERALQLPLAVARRSEAQLLLAQVWEQLGQSGPAERVYDGLALLDEPAVAAPAALGAARLRALRGVPGSAEELAAVAFHYAANAEVAQAAWHLGAAALERTGDRVRAADWRARAAQIELGSSD